jgi:hypothetical protein
MKPHDQVVANQGWNENPAGISATGTSRPTKRHAEQSNPFAPEGNHSEYSPLRYAFQFNDRKMLATG